MTDIILILLSWLMITLTWIVVIAVQFQGDKIMASIEELKAAVDGAVASVKSDFATALAKEKAEIAAQFQALKDQLAGGAVVSQADLDSILASVNSIGATVVAAVDTISTEDGA